MISGNVKDGRGFSLIEVLVALAILTATAFPLLSLFEHNQSEIELAVLWVPLVVPWPRPRGSTRSCRPPDAPGYFPTATVTR